MNIEKFSELVYNECYPYITTIETLHIAKSFQPITTINIDYEIDSNCSEEVYSTQEGLVTSSMIDHRLNFEEMSTEEAIDLMSI